MAGQIKIAVTTIRALRFHGAIVHTAIRPINAGTSEKIPSMRNITVPKLQSAGINR